MGANFSAGRLKDHVEGWKSLTTDPVILDAIKHYHIALSLGVLRRLLSDLPA